MAWFDDKNLDVGKGLINKIPTSFTNIGGEVIRNAIGLGRNGGLSGPVRQIPEGNYAQLTGFSGFLSDIRARGVSRSNRYIVLLHKIPDKIGSYLNTSGEGYTFSQSLGYIRNTQLSFFSRSCESAAFPGQNIQTQDAKFQSYMAKFPILRNYNETTWSFRCDNEMLEKKFFDLWSAVMINKDTGDVSYKQDYAVSATIIQFDEHGRATYAILLENMFPINIADLELTQTANNDYHRLTVTFAYEKQYVMSVDNPDYSDVDSAKANGAKSLTLYDKITNEVFKQGKNVVLKQVNKNIPFGNIPGVGNSRDILGLMGI